MTTSDLNAPHARTPSPRRRRFPLVPDSRIMSTFEILARCLGACSVDAARCSAASLLPVLLSRGCILVSSRQVMQSWRFSSSHVLQDDSESIDAAASPAVDRVIR